jgi:hypothetical protein
MEEKPENFFKIDDGDDVSNQNKGEISTSSDQIEEDEVIENKEVSIDDLKGFLKSNNLNVEGDSVENYYSQINENKTIINEYNQAISELEDTKKLLSEKTEGGKINEEENSFFTKKFEEIEKKLAEINVEKQQAEDVIKSTIHEIVDNSENTINEKVKIKNSFLSLILNNDKSASVSPNEDIEKEEAAKEPSVEEPILEEPIKEQSVEEFLGEEPVKEPTLFEEPIVEEPVKEPVVEEPIVEEPVKEPTLFEEPIVEELVKEQSVEGPIVEELVKEPPVEEPIVEEPLKEPVVEEPIVEEPVKEPSLVEEPIIEGPVKEQSVEESIIEEPVKEPVVEEPIIEEPVKEPSLVEEPIIEGPVKEQSVEESIIEEPVKEPVVEEPIIEEPVKELSENKLNDENDISNLKKEEDTEFSEKSENVDNVSEKAILNLSETMKKGFESVLSAIQNIPKNENTQQKQESFKETPEQAPQNVSPQEDVQDKPKTPQKNYIEQYRESLRSNSPIEGFVGIRGIKLKANNIGSYI